MRNIHFIEDCPKLKTSIDKEWEISTQLQLKQLASFQDFWDLGIEWDEFSLYSFMTLASIASNMIRSGPPNFVPFSLLPIQFMLDTSIWWPCFKLLRKFEVSLHANQKPKKVTELSIYNAFCQKIAFFKTLLCVSGFRQRQCFNFKDVVHSCDPFEESIFWAKKVTWLRKGDE